MSRDEPELLKGLSDDEAERVVALGARMQLDAGSELFGLGDAAESIFLVTRGCLALTLPMQVGGHGEEVLVEERWPGQAIGWSALIPPHRFTLSAKALLDSEVLALPRRSLLDHFTARPAAGYIVLGNIAAVVGQRLQVFQAMWLRQIQHLVDRAAEHA